MAGRFPGAEDLDAFWRNLAAGAETLSRFSAEELERAGLPREVIDDPAWVPAAGEFPRPEMFDAAFFGFTRREAEITDPQHRVLLECCWEALEHGGYDPRRYPGQVGVFAGSGGSRYLHVKPHPELAWWLVRVQLVDEPGYMVNYGLGAVVTADLRQRIVSKLGPFATGDERWFGWLSQHLLGSGQTYETAALLREFLGRPVTPQALLTQIARIKKKN